MDIPSAEQILQEESKPRPLTIEPWVAVYLGRLWNQVEQRVRTIASGSLIRDQANPMGRHVSHGTYSSETS